MDVSFHDQGRLLLEVTSGETITLDGPPEGVLHSFPSFLELEDHREDTWVFRIKRLSRDTILFGRIRFRCHRGSPSMEIGIREKPVSPPSAERLTFFPENAPSLSHLSGEVLLHPGEYDVSQGVYFSGTVCLFGEKGVTVLSGTKEVVRIENAQNSYFSGLTFLHRGTRKGNVVVVLGGKVTFEHCTFSGGVQEKLTWMGNGLVIARGAEVVLRHCVFLNNQGSGIVVEKDSLLLVEDSLFCCNGKEGLSVRENASAQVYCSVFRENAWGICLLPGSQGEFHTNRIESNKLGGVLVSRKSRATFRANTVRQHPVGVVLTPDSITCWEENTFAENQKDILEEG
ncbi:MAG: right-handed parallel beta-helix repeat-containing protein [Candidatus Atribacteria bacterium]|nr:right-handed parallel beta-helix repeat-containing protein [Candidatus Atribacteria bacterium]